MSVLTELQLIKELLSKQTLLAKKVLTLDEVVVLTGFTTDYIYQLIHKKQIPHSKPTKGKLFFDREKIEAWLLSNPATLQSDLDQKAASYILRNRKH